MAAGAVHEPVQVEAAGGGKDTNPSQAEHPGVTPPDVPRLTAGSRYQLLELIGRGGMGRVYKDIDLELKGRVALKFLIGGDDALEKRFLQEARAQARVDHFNVCK